MTQRQLTLISHHLCPYVQRAVIALSEKRVSFERIDVDLANKPDWFRSISPLGKTPVLKIGNTSIFESAVIMEYLEETQPNPMHPEDPLKRAEHRSWIEFGSSLLNDIGGFYTVPDEEVFEQKRDLLSGKILRIEQRLDEGPWFDGNSFSLVDATFGPVFRYFEVFEKIAEFKIFENKPKVERWRASLSGRPSIRGAVGDDYGLRLWAFLEARNSHLSRIMEGC